jgi:hypothetical protein
MRRNEICEAPAAAADNAVTVATSTGGHRNASTARARRLPAVSNGPSPPFAREDLAPASVAAIALRIDAAVLASMGLFLEIYLVYVGDDHLLWRRPRGCRRCLLRQLFHVMEPLTTPCTPSVVMPSRPCFINWNKIVHYFAFVLTSGDRTTTARPSGTGTKHIQAGREHTSAGRPWRPRPARPRASALSNNRHCDLCQNFQRKLHHPQEQRRIGRQ